MKHVEVLNDGSRIGYVELPGNEPVRIFVHGLGSSSLAYYTSVATDPKIAGQRTLLIDLLGFGISDRQQDFGYSLSEQAAALASFMDKLEISKADVIAHSMGGAIAIMLASTRPDLVGRLVVCEANLLPTPRPRIDAYSEDLYIAEGFASTLKNIGNIWSVTMRLADPVAMYRSEQSLGKNMPTDLSDRFINLPMPHAFIQGERSPAPHDKDRIVAADIPIITIPDAGHNMMLDNQDAFISALEKVLR
ncbi:alpha/beta fold hydrolase [Rhizobium oryziradicis]|uniref:Alpha/beta hydrolase n=1 Tax=Rhizobium oryziradicis TaxID=1867956 RepID=A0A1Q8ZR29_9HYPH|nr:alpha/beta hydrolase [Rhizobium oryziradicis]OLP44534.1 alpha/beta hydrolase [Rhizobium oryziradicis]